MECIVKFADFSVFVVNTKIESVGEEWTKWKQKRIELSQNHAGFFFLGYKVNYKVVSDLTTHDSLFQDSSWSFHEPHFSKKHILHESYIMNNT